MTTPFAISNGSSAFTGRIELDGLHMRVYLDGRELPVVTLCIPDGESTPQVEVQHAGCGWVGVVEDET